MKRLIAILATVLLFGCGAGEKAESNEASSSEVNSDISSLIEESHSSAEPVEEEQTRVSFVGVGDNLIHDSVLYTALQEDGSYDFTLIYDNIAEAVEDADLAFLNQETIFAGPDYPYTGYPAFNTPDEMGQNMYDLGFDLINGATNHTLDYDYPGAIHAIQVWDQYEDLIFTGTYLDEES